MQQIDAAVTALKNGALCVIPTETVYGLAADASNEAAVRRIFAAKGRPSDHPLIVHVADAAAAEAFAAEIPPAAQKLMDAFWPGPLTLVLKGGERRISPRLRGPEGGIAVRWTSHSGLQRLITALGDPLTSTSANRPGVPPAMKAADVLGQWHTEIARGQLLLLDGGELNPSAPSTVVDCTTRHLRVIRPGAIPAAVLRESCPELVGDQ